MLKCFLFALSLLSQIVDELCFAVYVFPISTRLELIIIIALAAATSIHYAVLESGLKWNGKGGLGHEKLSSRFGKVCSCSLTPKLRQLSRVVNVAFSWPLSAVIWAPPPCTPHAAPPWTTHWTHQQLLEYSMAHCKAPTPPSTHTQKTEKLVVCSCWVLVLVALVLSAVSRFFLRFLYGKCDILISWYIFFRFFFLFYHALRLCDWTWGGLVG